MALGPQVCVLTEALWSWLKSTFPVFSHVSPLYCVFLTVVLLLLSLVLSGPFLVPIIFLK